MEIQRVTHHLNVEMVEQAYREGIFPMADIELGIVTWHRPRRRAVLPIDAFHISRSLERTLRRGKFAVTYDQDFAAVMAACSERKPTWISSEFQTVYGELHALGKAHSVEVWVDGRLAGGVYGVQLGGAVTVEGALSALYDGLRLGTMLACVVFVEVETDGRRRLRCDFIGELSAEAQRRLAGEPGA